MWKWNQNNKIKSVVYQKIKYVVFYYKIPIIIFTPKIMCLIMDSFSQDLPWCTPKFLDGLNYESKGE
jgi:hypothetical protein